MKCPYQPSISNRGGGYHEDGEIFPVAGALGASSAVLATVVACSIPAVDSALTTEEQRIEMALRLGTGAAESTQPPPPLEPVGPRRGRLRVDAVEKELEIDDEQ